MDPAKVRFFATLAISLALSSCTSMKVGTYVERGTDMHRYHTYNWVTAVEQSTGDPRLDNNRIFQEYVQSAIEDHLRIRGFEKAVSPDLLVRYHATVRQTVYTDTPSPLDAYCDDCRPEVNDAGTLLVDLVDARTNRLVWRGWAQGTVDGMIDDQKWLQDRIDEVVARILRNL